MNQDSQMMKRFKSFAWRLWMMTIVFVLAFISENVASLELSESMTVVIGLLAGEVSKYLNTKYPY